MRRGNVYTQKQKLRVAGECLVFCTWQQLKAENIAKKRNEQALFESSRSKINIYCFFSPQKLAAPTGPVLLHPPFPKATNPRTQRKSYSTTYLLSLDSSIRTSHAFNHIIHLEENNWLEADNGIFNYANCFIPFHFWSHHFHFSASSVCPFFCVIIFGPWWLLWRVERWPHALVTKNCKIGLNALPASTHRHTVERRTFHIHDHDMKTIAAVGSTPETRYDANALRWKLDLDDNTNGTHWAELMRVNVNELYCVLWLCLHQVHLIHSCFLQIRECHSSFGNISAIARQIAA